jgi:DNA-binding SARP family transcriptional activator
LDLDGALADARWSAGDWDGAVEAFEHVLAICGDAGLDAGDAWRFGALLYLRGDRARAEAVLSAARAGTGTPADDALVSAWLGSTLWRSGRTDEAAELAEVALRQARGCADPRAVAAAEVAKALVCASQGDRVGNTRAYRAALRAATTAGDVVQIGRIHANLASKALEEGNYLGAVDSADQAILVAAEHAPIVALALENKAEALIRLGRLEQARAAATAAIEAYEAVGAEQVAVPELLLAEVYRLRGDQVQARLAFERALRAAELAEDAHAEATACAGLAWVLAADDAPAATALAERALDVASALERPAALNAAAWVQLVNRAAERADELAAQAVAEAQRTSDRPALATALEIRGAAGGRDDLALFRAALATWQEIGDPIAAARISLAIAADDLRAPARARQQLADLGAALDVGVAGLLVAPVAPSIATLGRFTVSVGGQPVPGGAWQSRKARDLLKLLAARGGRAITRDAAAEALWPGESSDAALGARLSVLLSRLRAILDPDRRHGPGHYIDADKLTIALRTDRVRVDVVDFLAAATEGQRLAAAGQWAEAEADLHAAEQLYVGDFLDADHEADWAVDRREQARSAAVSCARTLARVAARRGDDEDAARWLLRLLERDPYDEHAWTALIAAEVRMRHHGEARHRYATYARRMAELDLGVRPFEALTDSLP